MDGCPQAPVTLCRLLQFSLFLPDECLNGGKSASLICGERLVQKLRPAIKRAAFLVLIFRPIVDFGHAAFAWSRSMVEHRLDNMRRGETELVDVRIARPPKIVQRPMRHDGMKKLLGGSKVQLVRRGIGGFTIVAIGQISGKRLKLRHAFGSKNAAHPDFKSSLRFRPALKPLFAFAEEKITFVTWGGSAQDGKRRVAQRHGMRPLVLRARFRQGDLASMIKIQFRPCQITNLITPLQRQGQQTDDPANIVLVTSLPNRYQFWESQNTLAIIILGVELQPRKRVCSSVSRDPWPNRTGR